jgi:hypothetical protein
MLDVSVIRYNIKKGKFVQQINFNLENKLEGEKLIRARLEK